jgi:threonyl-tRNA synthetase
MPERLGAAYVAESGAKQTPVMLHRAILGSMERFIGILIEHHAGFFPLWLAPIQVVVLNITDRQAEYAENVAKELRIKGLRVNTDLRNEKIGFKIREHSMQRIPYLLIVGDKEVENGTATLRTQNGNDLGGFTLADIVQRLAEEIQRRVAIA